MNNVQPPKPPTPTPEEWKRFDSVMDALVKAPPAHRVKPKAAKKKPRQKA